MPLFVSLSVDQRGANGNGFSAWSLSAGPAVRQDKSKFRHATPLSIHWEHWMATHSTTLPPPHFPVQNTSPRAQQSQNRGHSPTHPDPLPTLVKQAALSFFLFLFLAGNPYLVIHKKGQKTAQLAGMPALSLPSLSSG